MLLLARSACHCWHTRKIRQMKTSHVVVLAVNETGLFAENVFKFAYDYYEVRVSKQFLVQRFLDYIHRDTVPEVVLDYCLEILSHRIACQKLLK
jgi:hypothetical protein